MNQDETVWAIARVIFESRKDWDEPGWDWYVENDRLFPAMEGEYYAAQAIWDRFEIEGMK